MRVDSKPDDEESWGKEAREEISKSTAKERGKADVQLFSDRDQLSVQVGLSLLGTEMDACVYLPKRREAENQKSKQQKTDERKDN